MNTFQQSTDDEFEETRFIAGDFILLGYADTKRSLKQDFYGTSKNKRIFKIISYNEASAGYESNIFHFDNEIVHAVPGDFNRSTNVSFLVCLKNESFFDIYHFDVNNAEKAFLGTADRLPFIFSIDNWLPAILFQKDNKTFVAKWTEGVFETSEYRIDSASGDSQALIDLTRPNSFPRLAENHSSAFIDLNGDLRPDLALLTDHNGEKYLEIYLSTHSPVFKAVQSISLPNISGPLIFSDFSGNGLMDVAYVSAEDGQYVLNVLLNSASHKVREFIANSSLNKKEPEDLFIYKPFNSQNRDFIRKLDLSAMFPDLRPVLLYDQNHFMDPLPGGIMACNFTLESRTDILMLMEDSSGKTHIRILENVFYEKQLFKPLYNQPPAFPKILSVSVGDFSRNFRDGLVVNCIENGDYRLHYIDNPYSKNRNRITVTVLQPDLPFRSYGSLAPGISCRYYVEENKEMHLGFSAAQSSYPHLQRNVCVIALGNMSYYGSMLCIGGPRTIKESMYNHIMIIHSTILPNSDLVAQPEKTYLKIELYLKLGNHVKNIVIVFFMILFCNSLLILYGIIKEKRKFKKKENKEFNFEAL